jgi:DNA-binding winged helix-turn-helix (wHTH) protein
MHGKSSTTSNVEIPQTLGEAMLTWGDLDLLAELRRTLDADEPLTTMASLFGKETAADRRGLPYTRVTDQLRADLIEKLCDGQLVATGFAGGAPPDALPTPIRPERWRVLTPDFETSSATGSDITLSDIRVAARDSGLSSEGGGGALSNLPEATVTLTVLGGSREISLNGQRLPLSNRLFDLVELLAKAASGGRVVPHREIESYLWGSRDIPVGGVVDAVRDLRRRIADALGPTVHNRLIVNRPGHGYMLSLPKEDIRIDP